MLMDGFDRGVIPLLGLAMLVLAVVAFGFALVAREDAYRAAGKQTKTFWLVILGITVVVDFFLPGMLFLTIMRPGRDHRVPRRRTPRAQAGLGRRAAQRRQQQRRAVRAVQRRAVAAPAVAPAVAPDGTPAVRTRRGRAGPRPRRR